MTHRRPIDAPRLWSVPDLDDSEDEPEEETPGMEVEVREDRSPEVLEGELVDARPVGFRAAFLDVDSHHPAATGARQVVYVCEGVTVIVRRLRDSRTPAPLERMMRAAEAVGDHETALMWADRVSEFRRDRHERRMDLIELPARVIMVLPKVAIGTGVVLVGIGGLMAAATRDITKVADPVMVVAETVQFLAVVGAAVWLPFLLALPGIVLLVLWVVGRRSHDNTDAGWLHTTSDLDMDIQIDETTIARALEALRIPQITAYLKEGLPLQYVTPCRTDGRGTHAVLRLPAGVTAERIGRRRADLASGLYRLAKEVWPTTGSEAGILDLWVADKGALAEGAGPYPLLPAPW